MEDLLQPEDSRKRAMVVSLPAGEPPVSSNCVSRSCPNMINQGHISDHSHGSLPDHLEPARVLGIDVPNILTVNRKRVYPSTPPPSPSAKDRMQKNLVLISSLLVDPSAPNFQTYYNSVSFILFIFYFSVLKLKNLI